MVSAFAALVISFLVTALATPVVRAWALKRGVVDEPGGRRVHAQATPRLGGVALVAGFFAPLAAFSLYGTEAMRRFVDERTLFIGFLVGAVVVAGVGAMDDIKGMGPWPKLAAQAVAATIAYASGFRIDAVDVPGLGSIEMGWLAFPVTLLWFLGVINALNLIDGLDGLAAGIALFASLANYVIAQSNGALIVALLSAGLAGSLLGFLRYNFNPAKIFMGDCGSMFLGFVLAATSVRGATTKSSTAVAILAPMVALGVPIFDTMLAMIRRTLAKQSMFSADRGHIHHRLLDLGLTHRRVVLILYVSSIVLALAALLIAFGRSWELGAALVLVGGVLFALVRAAGAAQRANRPLTGEAERAAALQALSERVERALPVVNACPGMDELQGALQELASGGRWVQRVALRKSLADPLGLSAPGPTTLVFDLGSDEGEAYELEVQLHPRLSPLMDAMRGRLTPLATACEQAIVRFEQRASRPRLAVAQ